MNISNICRLSGDINNIGIQLRALHTEQIEALTKMQILGIQDVTLCYDKICTT